MYSFLVPLKIFGVHFFGAIWTFFSLSEFKPGLHQTNSLPLLAASSNFSVGLCVVCVLKKTTLGCAI